MTADFNYSKDEIMKEYSNKLTHLKIESCLELNLDFLIPANFPKLISLDLYDYNQCWTDLCGQLTEGRFMGNTMLETQIYLKLLN